MTRRADRRRAAPRCGRSWGLPESDMQLVLPMPYPQPPLSLPGGVVADRGAGGRGLGDGDPLRRTAGREPGHLFFPPAPVWSLRLGRAGADARPVRLFGVGFPVLELDP